MANLGASQTRLAKIKKISQISKRYARTNARTPMYHANRKSNVWLKTERYVLHGPSLIGRPILYRAACPAQSYRDVLGGS